jgi:hypothetical protein
MIPPSFYNRHLFTFGQSSIGASDSDHGKIVTIRREKRKGKRSGVD